MRTKLLALLIIIFLPGCCSYVEDYASRSKAEYYNYAENFESPIYLRPPQEINDGSYISYGDNGWISYIEKTSEKYSVSDNWMWNQTPDSYLGDFAIEGITSRSGLGCLWLCKSYKVSLNEVYDISVRARTKRTHSGGSTGPEIVVFSGEIVTPSVDNPSKISSVFFKWDRPYFSDWTLLNTKVIPKSNYITIALKVQDSWNSYSVSHQFDDLKIIHSDTELR